ncbi:MAG: c-type cytochrome, partial [Opitutaceae bacterium]|nr:c-type cytochrome [Opitutaceae bacterium]
QNIRTESLAKVPPGVERVALDALSKPPPPSFATAAVTPQGPGRAYTLTEAVALIPTPLTGRDFARGKSMFTAAACILCHRFGEDGGGIGPDLTGAGSRYTLRDLLQAIIEPSHVISDQYGSEQIDLADGSTLVGRVVGEADGSLQVMANPFVPDDKTLMKVADVKSRKVYPISMMPPGLINGLNEQELQDLVAYLLSGGNASAASFQRAPK